MEGVNTRIGRATRLAFQHCEGNSPVASRSRQRATSYAHSRAPIPPRASPLWAAHRSQRFCAALAVPTERTAVVIDRDTPPDALRLSSIYVPDCHDDELLVEVHAAGVNALDWFIAKAVQKIPRFARQAPGFVPGKDISGVVVGVGSGVTEFKEGDEVFGMTGFGLSPQAIARVSADNLSRGAYATYTTIKAGITAKKPPNLTHVQAAAIPLASLAAWKAIVGAAKLQEGSKVVILNAAGGVGTMATQLAKRYCKAGTVAATCSSSSAALVIGCGADLIIDYRREDFEKVLKGGDYDAVVDFAGYNDKFARAAEVLKPESGMLVDLVGPPSIGYLSHGQQKDSVPSYAMQRMKDGQRVRYRLVGVEADGDALRTIARLLEDGTLRPVVDKVYDGLGEVQAAFDYNESGRCHGKVVISVKE